MSPSTGQVGDLPTGTVTFLFTDIEGSTRMVQALGAEWGPVLEIHNQIMSEAIERFGGVMVKSEGDSFFAAFPVAADGLLAAVTAQRRLGETSWPPDAEVKVRMGLHTGAGALGGADYVGLDVHRAARIAAAAHGGQIVISEPTAVLVERSLADGIQLLDLGKHRLKDLLDPEAIFQVVSDGLATDFPMLKTLDAIPNNLPVQLTSFVGRDRELAEAIRLLTGTRLLTMTGPGGTGKTRLALQVAAETSDRYDDGVFFVGLSPIGEAEVVPSAILQAFGIAASGKASPQEHLNEQIRSKNALLVLDNFEHLLAAAPVVSSLLKSGPRAKVIVTSRAPLHLSGEQEMPVLPLQIGNREHLAEALDSEAVRLFNDRAMAVRPDFQITEDNIRAVIDIVERLDGLPLAIELVASRLRLLPVEELANRLDAGMLRGGSLDLPERQRTIESAIAWSYELLDESHRTLMARLAIFSGGARLQEIEAVVATQGLAIDLLDGLSELIDHSLVQTRDSAVNTRFRMLHVIREFALHRLDELGESEAFKRAHLQTYHDLAWGIAAKILGHERKSLLDLLETEHDNIRSALEWGIEHTETELVQELAFAMWRYWQARGHLHEAGRRIAEAMALPGGTPFSRLKILEAQGGVHWWRAQIDDCERTYEQAVELARELGDQRELANAVYNHGLVVASQQDFARGVALLTEAGEIYANLQDENGMGDIAWGMGNTLVFEEKLDESLEAFLKAAEHYRRAGNEFGTGWSDFEIAFLYLRKRQPQQVWRHLREAISLFSGHRDVSGLVMTLFLAGGAAQAKDDLHRAYALAGAAEALRRRSGADIVGLEFNRILGLELEALDQLTGDDREAFQRGLDLDINEAVAYALDWDA